MGGFGSFPNCPVRGAHIPKADLRSSAVRIATLTWDRLESARIWRVAPSAPRMANSRLRRAVRTLERAIPHGDRVEALLRSEKPDLLLVTPLVPVATPTLVSAVAVSVLVLAAAAVFGWVMVRMPVPRTPGAWPAIGIVALYGFSGAVLCAVMLAWPGAAGFHVGHLVITVGWTVCALVLLARGINSVPARITGLVLVSAAVLKVFTFDLIQLDGIIRVGAFLGTGVVLLIAGVRYAKLMATSERE